MKRDEPVLQKCQAVLYTLYRERLKGVVLYGSCARGTDRTESDIDLMILLEGPVDAARALLLASGQTFTRHRGILTAIRRDYVRTGRLPVEAGRIISSSFDLRALGDSGGAAHVSDEGARLALAEAKQFLQAVRRLLPPTAEGI